MRTNERREVKRFEYVPTNITCNKCGEHHEITEQPFGNKVDKFQDILLHFGYGSKFDGESIVSGFNTEQEVENLLEDMKKSICKNQGGI